MKIERKFLIIWLAFAIIMIFSFYLMISYERTTPTRNIPPIQTTIQKDTFFNKFEKDIINLNVNNSIWVFKTNR